MSNSWLQLGQADSDDDIVHFAWQQGQVLAAQMHPKYRGGRLSLQSRVGKGSLLLLQAQV